MNFMTELEAQAERTPYFHLDGYMLRYWLGGMASEDFDVCARLHVILRSDSDTALHDHPADSLSIILDGTYDEVLPDDQHQHPSLDASHYVILTRRPGDVIRRKATDRHRLVLSHGPVKTIFVMGQWKNNWGFYTPYGKVWWRTYLGVPADAPDPDAGATTVAR